MMKQIKVNLQQPSIPTYRKDFFEKLNDFVSLSLFYGNEKIPSDLPNNVRLQFYKLFKWYIGKFQIKWHYAQLAAVKKDADVVILSWDVQYLTLWLAILKAKSIKKPLILWGHGYSKNDSSFRNKIRNFSGTLADAIIVYDHVTADRLNKIFGDKVKVFTAPNSLNYNKIQTAKNKIISEPNWLNNFRNNHAINDSYNLIYIGRIYKENKIEILFNALAVTSKTINNVKLIMIGDDTNNYSKHLKNLASVLNIDNRIIWTGALYNEEDIAPWMLSSKIFCYPENVGLSLIHAFAYGLPAITNDSYNNHGPEIWALTEGVNGLTYKQNDFDNFANQIIKLYNDEELRNKLSRNALNTVKEKFNLDKMASGFLSAINYCIKNENNTYNFINGL